MTTLHYFPSNPTVGQQYSNSNGNIYTWDGVKWVGAVIGSAISTIGYGTYTVSVNTSGNFVIPAGAIIEHADGSPAEFPGGTLINGPYRFTLTTSGSITLNGEPFHSGGVIQSSTPPTPANTSTLWYDIGSGRSYVYYSNSWVDAAPEPSVPTHISAFTNDLGYITATNTLVSGTYTFAVSSTGSVTLNGISFSSQGVQGTTGSQGITGSNGTNGTQGAQGTTGSQGITGSNGTNGTQGSQGTAGSIGTNGTQGTQGVQGTIGTTGSQGTSGTNGTNGVQGIQGISGSASLNNLSTSISFTNTGVNPPTFVTTSTGVKISYYQQESASTVDYATGIEPGGLWTSIPSATSNYAFKWYGGTSTIATLTGTGTFITNTLNVSNQITTPSGSNANLVLNPDGLADVIVTTSTQILMYATNTSISTTTGALVVTGGVGVGGTVTANKFVGDGSSLTNVTVTQQANIVGVQPNVTLVAGSYSYVFDNTSNFTMPTNGDIIVPGASGNINVGNTVYAAQTGTSGGYAFVAGPGASSQAALLLQGLPGVAANMAIRDNSTVSSSIYYDVSIGGTNHGMHQFRGTSSFTQYAQIDRYGINLPTRPAFRVYGAGTTQNLGTTVNTNGILNGNNFAVDYQQGTALSTSTGVFTAPVAGLYSIHLNARVYSNTAPSAQAIVIKNYATTSSNMVMWETAANSTVNHFGVSTIAKLAVGDTLVLKVTIGSINFDANDSWAVAYIG